MALAEIVAAFAAALAIVFAVREFRHQKRDDLDARIAELLGVSLSYRLEKPRRSEVRNNHGIYSYKFTVHNPGRLPINQVSVWMDYPGAMTRVHSDGSEDPQARRYEMYVASVAARDTFTWERRLKVHQDLWSRMRDTKAQIWFTAPDAGEFMTMWPARTEAPKEDLGRRLDQRGRSDGASSDA